MAVAVGKRKRFLMMDTSMAVQDCLTADIKGDHRNRDVICISGQAPNNLTWYEYTGK